MQEQQLSALFGRLKDKSTEVGLRTAKQRKAALYRLEKAVIRYRDRLKESLNRDFGKPAEETDLTEILPLVSEIRHMRRHLGRWLAPRSVPNPLPLFGASSRILRRPKGVVLIISPWNYPVLLTLSPLAGAIAGGNTVVLKPSEFTPHTSSVLQSLIQEVFADDEVVLVQGEAEVARTLLNLPFNHIFFTGSTRVGKLVMKAAAEHLGSVTLELGGKSPVIVDASANIDKAARRIAWGKFLNAGQTCVAPDHILAHKDIADQLSNAILNHWESFLAGRKDTYSQLIHDGHLQSRQAMLEELPDHVLTKTPGAATAVPKTGMLPTIILEPASENLRCMQEEIFGPLLPIHTFQTLDEAIQAVNQLDRPLVTYVFSGTSRHIKRVEQQTASGAVCINHTLVYLFNPELPFGGVNASGHGRSHGYYTLREFTYERAVFHQRLPVSVADMLRPPYNGFKRWLIDFSLKYL